MADPLEESGTMLTASNTSSLVMDTLCSEENVAVVGFYCDFHDRQEQTAANIIGAILKQLVVRVEMTTDMSVAVQKAKRNLS